MLKDGPPIQSEPDVIIDFEFSKIAIIGLIFLVLSA
jgi:hypothetical protein